MKRQMQRILLMVVFVIGGGSSLAQSQSTDSKTWFGTSASLHYVIPSFDFHVGVEDALGENIDIRTTLSGVSFGSGGFVGGGINGIINLSDPSSTTNSYIGFGPRAVLFLDSPSDSNFLAFGMGGLWGAEFFAQNATRPFVELNATLPISAGGELIPAFLPILSLSTGVNFHF